MSREAINKAAKDADRLLDDRQRARLRQLNGIEKLIFVRLMLELTKGLEESNGRITSRRGFVSLGKAVDQVFDYVEGKQFRSLARNTVRDVASVVSMNAKYYRRMQVVQGGRFGAIQEAVAAAIRKRLGVTAEDDIRARGYLDQLFATNPAREEIKKTVAKSVAAGVPMSVLARSLRIQIQGTKNAPGVLERTVGGFVLDTYNQADALTNQEFAKRLDLRYFIYSGGLIETSREFCRKRDGQVFTTEEAEKWGTDKTLPRTKAEKEAGGKPAGYVPLVDRGRWNCRHRILYISEQMAFARRPDLRPKTR